MRIASLIAIGVFVFSTNPIDAATNQHVERSDSKTSVQITRVPSETSNHKPSWEHTADAVVSEAKEHIGPNYKYGAAGPDKFDCSGLAYYSFKEAANIKLPRSSRDQAKAGDSVSFNDLRKGDIVYFGKDISHIGIYIGNGQFISALNEKKGIRISDINNSYWKRRFITGRRVIK